MNIGKRKWYFLCGIILFVMIINALYFFFMRQLAIETEPQVVLEMASRFKQIGVQSERAQIDGRVY